MYSHRKTLNLQVQLRHTIYNHIEVAQKHGEISLYSTMDAKEISCKDALNSEWYEF
jgi:hypothetical protein